MMRASAGGDRPAMAALRKMATVRKRVAKVLPSVSEGAGTARPHLPRISGARKSLVAVAGERCVLLNVRHAPIAIKLPRGAGLEAVSAANSLYVRPCFFNFFIRCF